MSAPELPVPNLPLLRKVLDHIDAHPDEWNQSTWGEVTWASSCGTAFCVAGHALVMSGYTTRLRESSDDELDFYDSDGLRVSPSAEACFLLGLTDGEADWLFDASNSRETVQENAEEIAARAGEAL
jgi:hypothetical protein